MEDETTLHIFWDCHCARAIWFSSPFACNGGGDLGFTVTVKDRIKWMLTRLPNELKFNFLNFLGSLVEGVWKARNDWMFRGKGINIAAVRCAILRKYAECLMAGEPDSEICTSIRQVRASGKINNETEVIGVCDASWKDGEAGLAVGLLETSGNKVFWFAKKEKADSAAEAEFKAIRWVMDLATQ
uniref:RNase H type-1 domain-containing protein n=1 Tax=Cannabis sativa TaxID=3483 RepID=A0A803Q0W2_CANSA